MLVENFLRPVVSIRVPLVISYIEQSGKWPPSVCDSGCHKLLSLSHTVLPWGTH